MARLPRLDYPGATQYICIQAVGKERLFTAPADFARLTALLSEHQAVSGLRVLLYCLLPDQIHLAVQTRDGNLTDIMHRLGTAYTLYANRTRDRQGPLLRGRFTSRLVQPDSHLLRLSRWLHLLPLRLLQEPSPSNRSLLSALRRYPHSSFRAYSALEPAPAWLSRGDVLALTGNLWSAEQGYSRYVREGILHPDLSFSFLVQRARLGIGDPRFLHEQSRRLPQPAGQGRRGSPIPELRRKTVPAVTVIRTLCRVLGVQPEELRRRQRETAIRPLTAWALSRFSGLTQQAIAAELDLGTGAAVSVQLRTLIRKSAGDPQIQAIMAHLETTFTC